MARQDLAAGAVSGAGEALHREFIFGRRRRILLATAELVAELGYRETTVELIARRSQVRLGSFYAHFSSKEACFLAAFEESVEMAWKALEEEVDPRAPWPERVTRSLVAFFDLLAAHQPQAKLCLVEARSAGSAARARHREVLADVAAKLRGGRELAPRAERLPDDLEASLTAGIAWLARRRLLSGDAVEWETLLPEVLRVTLAPYVGEVEATRSVEAVRARAVPPTSAGGRAGRM